LGIFIHLQDVARCICWEKHLQNPGFSSLEKGEGKRICRSKWKPNDLEDEKGLQRMEAA
jgi:hypothetical protein